ncbi:MAG: undecaprenyl-diphosphate phosphatase, partial [Candidatus Fervidibacter sacchari]
MNSIGLSQLLLLAVVQGLTEFLPVSSSGHLALLEHWLKIPEEARLSVTVFLHLGTLFALLVYFRSDLALMVRGVFKGDKEGQRLLGYVLLANIATAI